MHLNPYYLGGVAAVGALSLLTGKKHGALSVETVMHKVYDVLDEINERVTGIELESAKLTLKTVGSQSASVAPIGLFGSRERTQQLVVELTPASEADTKSRELDEALGEAPLVESVINAVQGIRAATEGRGDLSLEKCLTVSRSFDVTRGMGGDVALSPVTMTFGASREHYHELELGFKLIPKQAAKSGAAKSGAAKSRASAS